MKEILRKKSLWLSILFMILGLFIVISFYLGTVTNTFKELSEEDVPNLTFEDGVLSSEDWSYSNKDVTLIVTDNADEDIKLSSDMNIVFLPEYITVITGNNTPLFSFGYGELFNKNDITKDGVIKWLENDMVRFFKSLHTSLVISVILLGIVAMEFLAIFTMVFTKLLLMFRKKKVSFKEVYISVHNTYLITIPLLIVGFLFSWKNVDYTFIVFTIVFTLIKQDTLTWIEKRVNDYNKNKETDEDNNLGDVNEK